MSHVRKFLSVLVVAACSPSLRPVRHTSAPIFVPPLARPTAPNDALAVRFAEGAAAPSGCFAISRRTGAVACVLGHYGLTTASGERHLTLLQSSDESMPDIPVRVEATDTGMKLERQSRSTLDAIMREGDFIALGPPINVPLESSRAFGHFNIELRRASTSLSEELPPGAGIFDLKVVVRVDERTEESTDVLFENTLTSVACLAPNLAVRLLEPSVMVIERECRLDDAVQPEIVLAAWLCNSDRARCD